MACNLQIASYIVFGRTCNTRGVHDHALALALDQVGDRWSLLVVRALLNGPRRYNELAGDVPGIAPNVLAARHSLAVTQRLHPGHQLLVLAGGGLRALALLIMRLPADAKPPTEICHPQPRLLAIGALAGRVYDRTPIVFFRSSPNRSSIRRCAGGSTTP